MTHSTKRTEQKKPREEFPLFPHARGYWAKKYKGKMLYFGKIADDPDGAKALALWLDHLAGRPKQKANDLTLIDLCNLFLESKKNLVNAKELSSRTWHDYKLTCQRVSDFFGRGQSVANITPIDFQKLRADIAKTRGHVALGNEVQRIRSIFRYAYEADLVTSPIKFGPDFKKPSSKTMRIARAKQGPKLFEAVEIRSLIAKANPTMKAMILLGVNAALGNNDCATLELSHIDLDGGWLNFPRPKTGINRRCALWKETVEAIRAVIAARRVPKAEAHTSLLFITSKLGSFARAFGGGSISKEFAKLLESCDLAERKGRGFYTLRHVWRTVADETHDQAACDLVMGHSRDDMASKYRERIDDTRLGNVANHVRNWLGPLDETGEKS